MAIKFNPLTGNFDFTGSGGGGAQYIDGEVATYADLPLDGSAALNTAWLVRTASGVWPVSRKQAGIYIRTATGGSNRDSDYTYAGTLPDVFSDAQFLIYDDSNTARSMQVEITDNETLTFKVTGTDSIVRSVAFALSAIILAALMASSAIAQNIGLVTATNGNIVTRRTNALSFTNSVAFSNSITFGTNAATIRTNLGLGNIVENSINTLNGGSINTTLDSTLIAPSQIKTGSDDGNTSPDQNGGYIDTRGSDEPGGNIDTSGGSSAGAAGGSINTSDGGGSINTRGTGTLELGVSGTRTTIVGSATTNRSISLPDASGTIALANTPVPSGAATTNSILTADGAGSSSFVVSRTQTVAMTNSAFRTNTTDTSTVNAQTNMVLNLDASSTYHFAFAFIITSATTGGFNARLLHSNATNGLRNTYVGRMGRPVNIAASDITASSSGTISLQAVNFAGTNIVVTGTGILSTGTSSGTLTFIWYQNTATNVATELVAGSMMTVTKINP